MALGALLPGCLPSSPASTGNMLPINALAATDSSLPIGVLAADPTYRQADGAAGIRLAVMNIAWSQWEPQRNVTSTSYVHQMVAAAAQYRSHGWQVAIDIGLQTPPSWVVHLTNAQLVDQNGATSGTADYEFSQTVRTAANWYIDNLVGAMGQVESYRVGLSQDGEMLYPGPNDNSWWAYDAMAQGRVSGLPAGVTVSPMPGWVPGQTTWRGKTVTTVQVKGWYTWYLGALTNAHAWEISAYRKAGFAGTLQLVMPGIGAPPIVYNQRIAHDLRPGFNDSYHTMNHGAVFWKVLDNLPTLGNTVVDISSVYDDSGTPRGNGCQASDRSTSLDQADPDASGWSDTRWLTYLAHAHQLLVRGENPGFTPASAVTPTVNLARACGLTVLQWAWDDQLNTDSGYASLAEVTSAARAG